MSVKWLGYNHMNNIMSLKKKKLSNKQNIYKKSNNLLV